MCVREREREKEREGEKETKSERKRERDKFNKVRETNTDSVQVKGCE